MESSKRKRCAHQECVMRTALKVKSVKQYSLERLYVCKSRVADLVDHHSG